MADVSISALPAATSVTGADMIPFVQGGVTKRANIAQLPTSGVTSVNTRSGAVTVTAADVGLGNVTNTSDANKPVSTAQANALAAKADYPTGGTNGQVLIKSGTTTAWATGGTGAATPTTNSQSGTAYTLALTDAGNIVENTGSTVLNITVPLNSAVAFPVGTVIEVYNAGTGSVALIGGSTTTTAANTNHTDAFTGSNGAAWPTGWTNIGGSATIQSNRGQLATTTTQFSNAAEAYTAMPDTTGDTDFVGTVVMGTAGMLQHLQIFIDSDGIGNFSAGAPTGYRLDVDYTTTGGANLVLNKLVAGAGTVLAGGGSGLAATTAMKVRLNRTGSTVQAKVWDAATAEPSTWTMTATDTGTLPHGIVLLNVWNETAGTAAVANWDDITITGAGTAVTSTVPGPALRTPNGLRVTAQYGSAALRKRASDEWVVSGYTVV